MVFSIYPFWHLTGPFSLIFFFCEIYFEYFCHYFLAIFFAISLGTPSRWIFTLWSGLPCLLFSLSFSKYFLPCSLFWESSLNFSSSFSVNFGRVCFIMFLIAINSLLLVLFRYLKNSHLFFFFFLHYVCNTLENVIKDSLKVLVCFWVISIFLGVSSIGSAHSFLW